MSNNPTPEEIQKALAQVRKNLESPEFQKRVEETLAGIKVVLDNAKIDRSKLFRPVDF